MIFQLLILPVLVIGGELSLAFGGNGIEVVDKLQFKFSMDNLIIKDAGEGLVSLEIPETTTREIVGEPDLPVLREFVAIPHRGDWQVVVEDVVTKTHKLDGKKVIPSKGELFMTDDPKKIALQFGSKYNDDEFLPTALLHPQHTMRDVHGLILEINPIRYKAQSGELELVVSCTIKLVSADLPTDQASKVVDATFYDLYNFHYINFQYFTKSFIKGDDLGRMAVFYESKFKDSAQAFADEKKKVLKDVVLNECGSSSSSLKNKIKSLYGESDSLTYVVLLGRGCPTFTCSTTRRECDVQYAQLSGDENDMTLDVFVSRISANSQTEVDNQLAKFKGYAEQARNGTNDWHKQTAGLALNLIGDEYKVMHRNLDAMTNKLGFTMAHYMTDAQATSTQVVTDWNKGLGVYFYIGHGSGTKWNCPQRTGGTTESDVTSKFKNSHMYTFILECACLNGGFKGENDCFSQHIMSKSDGGAISIYSSAPVAKSSSPKDLQSGAVDAMTSKSATRVGPIYYAGIMAAYKLKPSQCKYTLEGYNMFGDPSLKLNIF
jgi:hypothetical protein